MNGTWEKTGNVLIIQRSEPLFQKTFLMTGDSFESGRYEITLQVFSYFKQAGCAFSLELHVPRLLRKRLDTYGKNLGLSSSITVLEDQPGPPESYEEIIDVTEMFGQSVRLRKSNRIINKTATSLIENLKNSFEEKDR